MALNAFHWSYRFVVLFFNCLVTFGSYFCFDMPSVLQDQFQKNSSCAENTTGTNESCCSDCLGMSPDDYNLLYAIYAWTNALVVIAAGFLIDKLGNRGVATCCRDHLTTFLRYHCAQTLILGAFLFSFLCVVGSSLFAAGAMMKGTSYMLPLMLLGRLIFGSGNGSLTIVQNRITSYWFKDKELALAFGFTLAFSRLGSVLNFLLTADFESQFGLIWTLWGGAMLCGLGFVSAITVSFLDLYGVKQLGDDEGMKIESKKLKVTDIKYFTLQFWLLVLTIMFFYNGIFPFVADASKFIHDKYKYSPQVSAYTAGAVYDVSMVFSPFLGAIIDIIGKRGFLALGCAAGSIPVFGLLAFTYVPPLVSTLWLGVMYSIAASSMWPSIPLVVSQATLGTAMGITTSIQMIGIGISNLVVGQILGKNEEGLTDKEILLRWKYVMIFLLGNTLACITLAGFLNLIDSRRSRVLNQSRRQRLAQQQLSGMAKPSTMSSIASLDDSEPEETDPLLPNRPVINT